MVIAVRIAHIRPGAIDTSRDGVIILLSDDAFVTTRICSNRSSYTDKESILKTNSSLPKKFIILKVQLHVFYYGHNLAKLFRYIQFGTMSCTAFFDVFLGHFLGQELQYILIL